MLKLSTLSELYTFSLTEPNQVDAYFQSRERALQIEIGNHLEAMNDVLDQGTDPARFFSDVVGLKEYIELGGIIYAFPVKHST